MPRRKTIERFCDTCNDDRAFQRVTRQETHTIRGTPARGRVAPDLTHVASRRQIANGVLDNRIGNYEAWIAGNESIKPGNQMPTFKELDGATLRALGSYLDSLR